jgi:putative endonuclease
MTIKRQQLGNQGEQLANQFLRKRGYIILAQNYRCPLGEIDIIAKDKRTLVFIEVKSRQSLQYGQPSEAVTYRKQQQISKVAQYYITANNFGAKAARFDVIAILLPPAGAPKIEHFTNAFELC